MIKKTGLANPREPSSCDYTIMNMVSCLLLVLPNFRKLPGFRRSCATEKRRKERRSERKKSNPNGEVSQDELSVRGGQTENKEQKQRKKCHTAETTQRTCCFCFCDDKAVIAVSHRIYQNKTDYMSLLPGHVCVAWKVHFSHCDCGWRKQKHARL